MTTVCMRRLATLLVVMSLVAALGPAAVAGAQEPPNRVRRVKVTRDIVFPIVGATRTVPGFGDCRDNCTREHHGNDILTYGWKGVPVVASHDGVISDIRDDGEWCNVEVTGEDGWYTRYVHMNNDTPGYDDQDYMCTPPGLSEGSSVKAGQLIGWVGDSGNAEHTQPHIHFEIRMPSGLPVDPYASLKAARRVSLYQMGSDDPFATAAEIAVSAYPEGAPVVTVMAIDDYTTMLDNGYAPLQLGGPLLLGEWDTLAPETMAALAELQPARVNVVGDLWLEEVLEYLVGRSELVEQALLEPVVADGLDLRPRLVEAAEVLGGQEPAHDDGFGSNLLQPEMSPAPYSIVFLGDRDELDVEQASVFRSLTQRAATTILDFAEPAGRVGRTAFEGIGRSGSRNTLYYPTGGSWTSYRAKEPPQEQPGYGVFVVEPGDLTAETLAFLESIADAPVLPFWR
ncbi:MAG: hypothetical protein BMS9Abin07_2031 [Acidimicrobiia bacterium]|nr:MAG: hypothetical protein BMS9Abin07_2031 [Acidimicrobiia bacterium]